MEVGEDRERERPPTTTARRPTNKKGGSSSEQRTICHCNWRHFSASVLLSVESAVQLKSSARKRGRRRRRRRPQAGKKESGFGGGRGRRMAEQGEKGLFIPIRCMKYLFALGEGMRFAIERGKLQFLFFSRLV